MRRLTLLMFIGGLLSGCGYPESHMGQARVGDILVTGRHSNGKLDFALACTYPRGDVAFTITNDPKKGTKNPGITFCDAVSDRFWFNGEPVPIPTESKVFAVRSDGKVVPIRLSEAELATLTKMLSDARNSDRIPDQEIERKIRAALKTEAGEASNQRE